MKNMWMVLLVLLGATAGCAPPAEKQVVLAPMKETQGGKPVIQDKAATKLFKELDKDVKPDSSEKKLRAAGTKMSAMTIATVADGALTTLSRKRPNTTKGGYDAILFVSKESGFSPKFEVYVPESRAKAFFNGAKEGQKVAVDLLEVDKEAKEPADYLRLVPIH